MIKHLVASALSSALLLPTGTAQTPAIQLWNGLTQSFGRNGNPQRWVNVHGTVLRSSQLRSLTFTLNGGPPRPLNIGPDTRRLLGVGDFNVEIDTRNLRHGPNTIRIAGIDQSSKVVAESVTLDYQSGQSPPADYDVDWGKVVVMSQAVQVVDGRWTHTSSGARPVVTGYDRIFAVGDLTWDDFEVTVPVTIHRVSTDPSAYRHPSVSPGLGITGRWTGHTQMFPKEQPLAYWLPQGGGPWYEFHDPKKSKPPELFLGGMNGMKVDDPLGRTLTLGKKYLWKLRVETLPSGRTWYGAKIWDATNSEPALYDMTGTEGTEDLQSGSLIFIAHHVDVTFGDISVRDLVNDRAAPVILGVASEVGHTLAVVRWKTDEPASTSLEFGKTTAYTAGSFHDSKLTTDHVVILRGLEPNTVYNFRVLSADGRHNRAAAQNATFATKAALGTGGLPNSTLSSDAFVGTTLDEARWQIVDPLRDGTFNVDGGRLRITATGTNAHDAWTQGNHVPRVMRVAPNADLDLQVKFDSPLTSLPESFRSQGILVEQDPDKLLRIELHSIDGVNRLFVADLDASVGTVHVNRVAPELKSGTTPMYLRVQRTGDSWVVSYSVDGSTWVAASAFTHMMIVHAVGVYAGNSLGTTHTTVIDEFTVNSVGTDPDATAPVISNLEVEASDKSAKVTWTTDEPADSRVEFGTTSSYGSSAADAFLVFEHEITITGLTPNTLYNFRVVTADAGSNQRASSNQTFSSAAVGLPASQLKSDSFNSVVLDKDVWMTIDPLNDATFAPSGSTFRVTAPSGKHHDVWGTTNHVPAIMRQAPDDDFDFHVKIVSPLPTAGAPFLGQGVLVAQDVRNLIRVDYHSFKGRTHLFCASIDDGVGTVIRDIVLPALSVPMYVRVTRRRADWAVKYSADGSTWTIATRFVHDLVPRNLSLYAASDTANTHVAEFDDFHVYSVGYQPDVSPPIITNISVVPGSTAANVTWNTDEDATSRVEFGATSNYSASHGSSALTGDHEVEVTGLAPNTTYHFRVASRDPSGNLGRSADMMFITRALPASSRLVADDFTTLDPNRWTLVHPLQDATATASGGNAVLALASSSMSRDAWTNVNTLPRLVQSTGDVDFDIEVTFASRPASGPFSSQGFMIEQDPANFIRVEFQSDGVAERMFVASVFGGNATVRHYETVSLATPISLRVRRAADTFAVTRTNQGSGPIAVTSFTAPMMVTRVGVHAGAGTNANRVSIDKFTVHSTATPDVTAPAISAVVPDRGDKSITIRWDTDEPASSKVVFGKMGTLEIGEIGTTTRTIHHAIQLPGLSPATSYFFKVVSRDASANTASTAIARVQTNASGGGGAPVIANDTFDNNQIDPQRWSFVDPIGDCTVSASGQSARIYIPHSSISHDVWIGTNTLARLMQPAPDDDWEVEAAFKSVLSGPHFRSQGILVEHDEYNVLRIEFFNWGGQTYAVAASIVAGNARIHALMPLTITSDSRLRVKRAGDDWSVSYSLNGSTWTLVSAFRQALSPKSIGVHAGSSPRTPHTVILDEFKTK